MFNMQWKKSMTAIDITIEAEGLGNFSRIYVKKD